MGTTPSGHSGTGAVVAAITTMLLTTMVDVVAVAVAVATLAPGAVMVVLLTVTAEAPGLIRDSGWRVFKLVGSGMAINGAAILCCMRHSMR